MAHKYDDITNHIKDIDLLKLAHKRNYCADNQLMTSFLINAGGRTILIGVDVNPDKLQEASCHCSGSDGKSYYTEGWSTNNKTREGLIKMATDQLNNVLEYIFNDLNIK